MMLSSETTDGVSFRRQLQLLTKYAVNPRGKPYSTSEIAAGIGISVQGLYYLLDGKNESPRMSTTRRICTFFDVPIDYFNCDTEMECMKILVRRRAAQSPTVIGVIDRDSALLNERGRRSLLNVIRWLVQRKHPWDIQRKQKSST